MDRQIPTAIGPTDAISAVKFSPTEPDLLLASSWDSHVRLYNARTLELKADYTHAGPVLDCVLTADAKCYSGGVDNKVMEHDPTTGKSRVVATHDDAVKSVAFHSNKNILYSGGWDRSLKCTDTRSHTSSAQDKQLPDKVYAMSLSEEDNMLVVAMAQRHVLLFDIRNMKEPHQRRLSSMKYSTRCIQMLHNGMYAMGSIEGRVAVEWVDPSSESQDKKYAFKCHRPKGADGVDIVYPVHSLALHPIHGTFASGGGDGVVSIWDGASRKRIRQFPKYPTSIASLCFNADGTQLAVASSYCFEEGDKEPKPAPDTITIKTVVEAEVRPKQK